MHRAYSQLEVKASDDDQRIIEGIASTPSTDRVGDILEPLGAKFKLPLPLLWQHRHDSPVGHVEFSKASKDGISFRAKLAKIDEPGELKNLLDKAWQAVKAGLVRGVSVGFKELEYAFIQGGGIHFKEWEWIELSLVTIPANADASITAIKAIDAELRATSGQSRSGRASPPPAGASRVVKLINQKPEGESMFNYAEKIKEFEGTRETKKTRILELTEESAKTGETFSEAQQEEFDTLEADVKSLNDHIKRLQTAEAINVEKAKPVDPTPTIKAGSGSRSTVVTVKGEEKLEPGISFARFAMCLAAAKNDPERALGFMQTHYPNHLQGIEVLKSVAASGMRVARHIANLAEFRTKTDVAAGTTAQATWAAPLVAYNQFSGDFVEYLRAKSIIGQVQDRLNSIPFNVHIRGQTSGGSAGWVGQGKPKPVTKFDFNDVYHGFFKVAAISVLTEELIRFSDPSAERLVRDALAGAVIEEIDTTFIDPDVAAVSNVSPASITNGVSADNSTGDTFSAVLADLQLLWAPGIAANLDPTGAFYVTTPSIALALSLMVTDLDQQAFPQMTMMGGSLRGIPVIVSNYVPAGLFILVYGPEIWLSDDGVVTIDASREASIQMMDNPTNDTATPTATAMVSMYQTNSVAFRAERYINWSKRRSTAVAVLDSVSWGGAAES